MAGSPDITGCSGDCGRAKDPLAHQTLKDCDPVNHPDHYTQGKIEVIDFIDDQDLDRYQANIVKYVCRWKHKGGTQDLRKAQWYLTRYINREEGKARAKELSALKAEAYAIGLGIKAKQEADYDRPRPGEVLPTCRPCSEEELLDARLCTGCARNPYRHYHIERRK